jgi:hypothetical protein
MLYKAPLKYRVLAKAKPAKANIKIVSIMLQISILNS